VWQRILLSTLLWVLLSDVAFAQDEIMMELQEAKSLIRQSMMVSNNMQNTIKLQATQIQELQITINNLKLDNRNLTDIYEKRNEELTMQLKSEHRKLNVSKARVVGVSLLALLFLFL